MSVLGLGVFIRAQNQKALADWYREYLEIDLHDDYYFASLSPAPLAALKDSAQIFSIVSADDEFFAPSKSNFALQLCVDNIEEMVDGLKARGVEILWQDFEGEYGKFAHILDVEGNKIELWQPPK